MSDRKSVATSKAKPAPKIPNDLEQALSSLPQLNIDAVRQRWQAWLGDEPPSCQSGRLLRLLLAWRLQEQRFGGLSADAKRRLRQLWSHERAGTHAETVSIVLKPGTMITREWRGVVQRVHVLEDGFAHEGKQYRSLSQIARTITGKRWSGPRFFGIEAEKINGAVLVRRKGA